MGRYSRVLCFIVLLVLVVPCHSFYEMLGDRSFTYDIIFSGTVELNSHFLSYKNDDVQFSFNYTITPKVMESSEDKVVFDIKISSLQDASGMHPMFVYLWNYFLDDLLSQVAYGIKTEADQFFIINKKMDNHPLGYFLECFLPRVNLTDNYQQHIYNTDLATNPQDKSRLIFNIEGWEFLKSQRRSTDPLPLFDNNKIFINNLAKSHSTRKKNDMSYIPWMQRVDVMVLDSVGTVTTDINLLGVYSVELNKKTMTDAEVDGQIKTQLTYVNELMSIPVSVILKGKFVLLLR